ncbi:hypothetical protein DBP20_06215 [Streptomyces sp. CS131]|nr:hypothetical protein DBP20_06215 [Streptomyces sp. CS131]
MPPQTVSLPSFSPPPASPSLTKDASDAVPRIVPVRRTGRWAAAVAVLVLLALAMDSVIRNDAFQWDVVLAYFATAPVLYFTTASVLRGLWLTAVVMVLGFVLGALLAVLRLSGNPVLQEASWGYVRLFRSTPILVQPLFWFNIGALYPQILGVSAVTTLLSIGQRYVERYYARGTAGAR